MQEFADGITFTRKDFTKVPLPLGEYDSCIFSSCNFTGSDLSGIRLIDCTFESCDLSLVRLTGTILNAVRFTGCKMLGLLFETCNQNGFSPVFENCNLSHSSFSRTSMKKAEMNNLILHETDLTGCDLSGARFENCDFAGAVFDRTNLENSDFRSSLNYTINPEKNRIRRARFSLTGLPGLLAAYNIEID
jgi:fluoroquinolone resistance protein